MHAHALPQRGFTLIELMVVVALVAILATLAMPSFNTLMANQRVTTAAQELLTLLQFARAEAVYKRTESTVTPNGQTWAVTSGSTVLRESVLSPAITVNASGEEAAPEAVAFDSTGKAKPASGATSYRVAVSASDATRVQCLTVTGAGLVQMRKVNAGEACS